jgi:hypothetical protein
LAAARAGELPAFDLAVAFGFNSARVALDLDFAFALFLPLALEWLVVDMAVGPLAFDWRCGMPNAAGRGFGFP